LDNNSGNNSGYADYTSIMVNMTSGASQSLTLTPGFSGGLFGTNSYAEYWKIWIDYNQDGDFTDAGELAFDPGSTSTTAVSGSFTVPATASTGNTRMRIQMKYNAAGTSCENFSYGEVEDYTVNIQGSTPPSCDVPSGLNSTNITFDAATLNWSSASGANSYAIQYRVSGGSWLNTTAGSTSKNLTGLAANTSYEWKVASDCGSTSSTYSTTGNFTTSAAPVCGDASNQTVSGIGETTATLNWSAGGNASSYEVRYRVSGGSWVNVTSSSTSRALSGLNDNTSYNWELRTVCSFTNSSYVAGPNFTTDETVAPPANYCASKGNSTTDEWIQSIVIGGMTKSSGNNSGYADFTATALTAAAGSSQSFTFTPGFSGGLLGSNSYPEYWRVWIDYNHDGDFTDAGELAFDAGGTSTSAVNGSFTVSSLALLGATRMRVQMKYNGAPTSCESFSYGEVEDYTINITAGSAFATATNSENLQEVDELVSFILNVYPNPSSGLVNIESDATGTVKVMDLTGSVLVNQDLGKQTKLHLDGLAKGMYILQLEMGSKIETKKLILK
jgi:hypothetical protein